VKFVPAGTDGVLFSVWDVRVKDFKAFVDATGYDATGGMVSIGGDGIKSRGDTWKSPGFTQTEDDPVVGVSWNDAKAFCQWLTKKEQDAGTLASDQEYRLPTDAEWSTAVGLDENSGGTPAEKNSKIKNLYLWGTQWPPPQGTGNFGGSEAKDTNLPRNWTELAGYDDGYPRTSPVGTFNANKYGLYDMGGNVWQWCEDKFGDASDQRVTRGACWASVGPENLLASFRGRGLPDSRDARNGFRLVLVVSHSTL
jgi:formylglycine-generating enzyme required for sulfatase activity